jgi:trans-2,3-dihydro-3-hydroxyanthranilate isomerase
MTPVRLDYDIVDVFTDRPFAGNQLAVVHGAGDLSGEQCLALAREFNLSETTFPTAVSGTSYATRIFTLAHEVPFAGHPTLGTAWTLRARGVLSGDAVVQRCGVGEVEVGFEDDLVSLAVTPRDLVGPVEQGLVTSLLADFGLGADDVAGRAWLAGCGLTFLHVPVVADAVCRARPSVRPLADYERALGARLRDPFEGVNAVAVEAGEPVRVRSRVFVPGVAVPEDPATGSAAAGLGVALVADGRLPQGGGIEIVQGVEMGRPSALSVRVEAAGGRAVRCHVAGRVQPVASGRIVVPG